MRKKEKMAMHITSFVQAADFLAQVRGELEEQEIQNGLPLGIALNLQKYPERIKKPPYLAAIRDEHRLVVAAVMTPPFNMLVSSSRAEPSVEALQLLIENLLQHGWAVPGMIGYAPLADLFAALWSDLTGQPHQLQLRERMFELTEVIAPQSGPGVMRLATLDDVELVGRWMKAFRDEALGEALSDEDVHEWTRNRIDDGAAFLWQLPDGERVSLACKTRPISHVISVGPVYTPPEQRGYGYASRCVAALSQHLLDSGWERCCLFTDLANPTSNSIYQKIGYRPVCDFNKYVFG
jgi:predicted GNAT family acetyltransferase